MDLVPLKQLVRKGIFPGLLQQELEILVVSRRSSCELKKLFRSISWSSFFFETMERLVDLCIKEVSLKDYPLNSMQHAYLEKQID
jgi:hypothetical protein